MEGASELLDEMNSKGITGAIVRKDGIIVHSTFSVSDSAASMLATVSNTSDAILKRIKDKPQETEIAFGNLIILVIPIKEYLFCGAMKSREQKQPVRQFAERAKKLL